MNVLPDLRAQLVGAMGAPALRRGPRRGAVAGGLAAAAVAVAAVVLALTVPESETTPQQRPAVPPPAPRISALERPQAASDMPYARRLPKALAPSARLLGHDGGHAIWSYTDAKGRICLVIYGGSGCEVRAMALGDQPLAPNGLVRGTAITLLLHDGPAAVVVERAGRRRQIVPVRNNIVTVHGCGITRITWTGLDGRPKSYRQQETERTPWGGCVPAKRGTGSFRPG